MTIHTASSTQHDIYSGPQTLTQLKDLESRLWTLNSLKIFPQACDQLSSELGRELATYSHTPKALGHAVIFRNPAISFN